MREKKIVLLILLFSFFGLSAQKDYSLKINKKFIADQLVDYLRSESYVKLEFMFNYELKKKLSRSKLKNKLAPIIEKYGGLDSVLDLHTVVRAENKFHHQGITLGKKRFDIVFTLDSNKEVSSFRLAPYSMRPQWEIPEYANPKLFELVPVKIGEEGKNPLLGEYTYATKQLKKIFVVMVHGSGPNDMDESLGPNKLFKDLAYGLGSHGISGIRYNKRTYDYPSMMQKSLNSITIDDIVTDDAVKAIKKAKSLGADQVFLLGHSLGGHLAPKIAQKEKVDGVILMAANRSPLEELIMPQVEYIMENDSNSSINELEYNALKYQIKNLKKGDYDSSSIGTLPFGLPGSFWKSMEDYQPRKIAKKQDIPYLILNGERDYQVTPKEAKKWRDGSKHEQSKTIIYENLNHMFYSGKGKILPAEYQEKGHLNEKVLMDIIKWIQSI